MNRSKTLYKNGLLLSKVLLTCLLLFYLLEPAFAQKQTIKDSKDLSKLNLFENLSGLENSWISMSEPMWPAYYAIKEKDPTHKIVESKTWHQKIMGPNNQRTGTNTVAYFLLKSSKHSQSELQDIVDYIFKDGPGSFPEKYKKLLDRDNKINYENMPNYTTSGSGAGYELGRTWSGIEIHGEFIEAEFDQRKQEMHEKVYRGICKVSSAITGTEQHKIKTNSSKPTKGRILYRHQKCKVVHHNQYILVAGVKMQDGYEHSPRENRDKDGWVQSYGPARPFPDDLWLSILTKLDPFLTNGKDVMDNIDTPPPGKIIGGTDEPMLPTDQPITGIQGEVTDEPEPVKYVIVNDLKGDVRIDYGNFVTKQLKAGDHINFGDIVVAGDNSWVHFWSSDGKLDFYVDGYSKIKICEKHIFPFKKRPKKGFLGTAWLLIEGGAAFIRKKGTDIMVDIGIWEAEKIDPELANPHIALGIHGSIVRVTHNKSSGDKSIAVVEGEAVVICSRQPEMLLSVKPGEKLTLDKYCRKQKYNLTKSEIQQITSVFPDVKKTTSLTPIADSTVYAYSYRNWNKANWGKYGSLGAGWNPTGGEKRTYLKFNLSGIDPKKVGKATLKLFHYHTGGNNSLSLGIYEVTSPWQEGGGTYHSGQTEKSAAPGEISWVNQPTFDLSQVASFKPGSKAGQYIDVDITPLVKAWLTGKPNYGLVTKPVGIMSGRAPESSYGFYSREHQDKSKRPVLVLSSSGTVGQLGEPGGGLGGEVIGGIRIVSATYGGNCGVAKGNVTAHIAEQCNGKSECRYTVDYKIIGDPARGCAKTYTVQYRCGNNTKVFEESLSEEAGWGDKSVVLKCRQGTGSGTVSGGSPVQGTAMLLTAKSNRDMVGRNETYKGNGRFDAVFRAQFSAPNRTVTAVEVSNTNGLRSVWDTRPNNRLWLGGVVIGGRTMNRSDGSVNFSLGSGQNTLDFFVEDNGSIRGGKTNYRMTIFFASGDPLVMDIIPGTVGQPGGIRIVSATYGGNCGVAKGNVTAHIAKQCNGKSKCRYVVNHKIIGDPAYGCAKTYTVRYRCGNNPRVFEKTLAAEAGWGDKAVLLECTDSSGGDGGTDTGWQTAGIDSSKSICPKAAQWQDGGGFMILNGSHRFDKGWFRRTWGKKDPFYLNGEDTKLAPKHSYDEVMKHAVIKLGKVTARGPGFLVVYGKVKGSGAWLRLYNATTGQQFWPHTGGSQKMYQGKPWVFKDGQWTGSWSGKWVEVQTADLSSNIQMGGWVPAKQTRTYEIKLDQGWYNNMNVPFGSMGYGAPKEIDYELWFFPREGGGVKLEKYPGSASTTGVLPPSQGIKKVITGYGKKK